MLALEGKLKSGFSKKAKPQFACRVDEQVHYNALTASKHDREAPMREAIKDHIEEAQRRNSPRRA